MKTIKKTLRMLALFGLLSIGLGLHELWADVGSEVNGANSVFEMKTQPNRSELQKGPPMDCMVKKLETICVRKNDRIEMKRYMDQNRKIDQASSADIYQQIVR